MRLNININREKEQVYWKLAQLKVKYKASSWLELLEILLDIEEKYNEISN